jgi:hypothetical protein
VQGNNPCMPYDACVETYAGKYADIVVWEQSFNCFLDSGDPRMIEQFIRQTLFFPHGPIVALAGSLTPNWDAKVCNENITAHVLSSADNVTLSLAHAGLHGIAKIITEVNKETRGSWGKELHALIQNYPMAGIEAFDHTHYEVYKCQGPYIPTWGVGAASWHPSISGHRLRAHQYAYVWMTAFRIALEKIKAAYVKGVPLTEMKSNVDNFLNNINHNTHKAMPPVLSKSNTVPDKVTCYTEFEPRGEPGRALSDIIQSGLPRDNTDVAKGWVKNILEQLLQPSIIENAKKAGYLDKKYIIYGNKNSGPLTMKFEVKNEGQLYLCEAPGVWGQLPKGFVHLWESSAQIFIAPDTVSEGNIRTESHRVEYAHHDIDEICVHIKTKVAAGGKLLSIVPLDEDKLIALSTLVIP